MDSHQDCAMSAQVVNTLVSDVVDECHRSIKACLEVSGDTELADVPHHSGQGESHKRICRYPTV